MALVATSTRYGYHRDEMYFIAAGAHPAFGYPDQPPIVPLVTWAMQEIAPGSLLLLRLPSELVAAATTVLAALVAREVGGSRRAQVIAAACTAASGVALAVGHFVTTTTFDLLSTTALGWLLVRAVVRGQRRGRAGCRRCRRCRGRGQAAGSASSRRSSRWSLLVVGPRRPLVSWWGAGGVAAAVALTVPYAVWQQIHGWPQLTVAGNIAGSAEGGRAGFIPFQLVMVSPFLVPVWVAGPARAVPPRGASFAPVRPDRVRRPRGAVHRRERQGLLPGEPVPAAAGARRGSGGRVDARARYGAAVLWTAIGLSAAISAVIALPLLPETSLQGSFVMAVNPDPGETVGWPAFADTVAKAWHGIPPAERRHTAIFTSNYGEAGAVDLLGASRGLPRAYSGHNGFSEWGQPPPPTPAR